MSIHGSSAIDFDQLQKDFSKICLDYLDELKIDLKSRAVEFCSKMIYEVGPQARQVKKNGDKTWRFIFPYNDNGKFDSKAAFVSTYKKDDAQYVMTASDSSIVLSVRNATLLALVTLERLNKIAQAQTPPMILLSPLAGAVFSKDDLGKIGQELGAPLSQIIDVVNASCQSGGHYLPNGRMHAAAVAAIVATRNVKDEKMKKGIIAKTSKQYLMLKKN